MLTLGLGLNVKLVFKPTLNIVQVFKHATVVNVVQHCSSPNSGKNGVFRQNKSRAAFGGAIAQKG